MLSGCKQPEHNQNQSSTSPADISGPLRMQCIVTRESFWFYYSRYRFLRAALERSLRTLSRRMEGFSFLTTSVPQIQNSTVPVPENRAFPSISAVIEYPTVKLPDVTQSKTTAQWVVQHEALWEEQHRTTIPKPLIPGNVKALNPSHCSVYRPWLSPYSFCVCSSMDSQDIIHTLQKSSVEDDKDLQEAEDLEQTSHSFSSCSPSTSLQLWDHKPNTAPDTRDRITNLDILKARGILTQTGMEYSCASCCRLFPSLPSLCEHIQNGHKEGYSCKAFYRTWKYLWERENEEESLENSKNEVTQEVDKGKTKQTEQE